MTVSMESTIEHCQNSVIFLDAMGAAHIMWKTRHGQELHDPPPYLQASSACWPSRWLELNVEPSWCYSEDHDLVSGVGLLVAHQRHPSAICSSLHCLQLGNSWCTVSPAPGCPCPGTSTTRTATPSPQIASVTQATGAAAAHGDAAGSASRKCQDARPFAKRKQSPCRPI